MKTGIQEHTHKHTKWKRHQPNKMKKNIVCVATLAQLKYFFRKWLLYRFSIHIYIVSTYLM